MRKKVEEMRDWLLFTDREDKEFVEAIKKLTDEQVIYVYAMNTAIMAKARDEFKQLVKKTDYYKI